MPVLHLDPPNPSTHIDWEARTIDWSGTQPKDRLSREEAQRHIQRLLDYNAAARRAIQHAQEIMIQRSNRGRRKPPFDVGSKVFIVKKKGWSTDRPFDKLDCPLTRVPYEIIERVKDNVFKLRVPEGWRATDQYNAERLTLYPDNPLPGQAAETPDPEVLDGEEQWEVDRVLASRLYKTKVNTPAWEDLQNIPHLNRTNRKMAKPKHCLSAHNYQRRDPKLSVLWALKYHGDCPGRLNFFI